MRTRNSSTVVFQYHFYVKRHRQNLNGKKWYRNAEAHIQIKRKERRKYFKISPSSFFF